MITKKVFQTALLLGSVLMGGIAHGAGSGGTSLAPTNSFTAVQPNALNLNFAWVARHGLTSQAYQGAFNTLVEQRYNLIHVSGYSVNGQARFAAIWDTAPQSAWEARHDLNAADFQTTFDTLVSQGYKLADLSGYTDNGQERYAAIWNKANNNAWQARFGLNASQYQSYFDTYVQQGFRLKVVNGYNVGGYAKFAAIWEKTGENTAWQARHNLSANQYQNTFNVLVGQGYRLVQVSVYTDAGQVRYAAIFDKKAGPAWVARHGLNSAQYQAAFDQYTAQGYHLKWVSGAGVGAGETYAAIWEQ